MDFNITEMKVLENPTNKKLKVEESKNSIEDLSSDSSSDELSDMSSDRVKASN